MQPFASWKCELSPSADDSAPFRRRFAQQGSSFASREMLVPMVWEPAKTSGCTEIAVLICHGQPQMLEEWVDLFAAV